MTHQQHPVGTGFTAASTVDDVLAGIDLIDPASIDAFIARYVDSGRLWDVSEQLLKA